VNKIPPCGVVVISNLAGDDISVYHPTVFGEMKLFAYSAVVSCLTFLRPEIKETEPASSFL